MKRGNRNNSYERGGQVSLAKAMGNVAKKGDKEINDGREEIKSIRKDITSSENQINNLNSKEKEIEKVIIDKKNEIYEIKDDLGVIYKTVQDAKKQKAKFAKGGEIEERVYAIDKRNFRSENLINTLDDEKFMDIAENEGLIWSSMDNFLDSNEYNEEGDNLKFREITVKMMVADEYVNPDFLEKGGETISREDIVEVLKDELEDVLEDANQEYEGQDIEGEEVEYKSRDGFIPYTDGGYEYRFFTYGNYLTGSGKSLPTNTLDGELERQEELNLEYGKERFEEEFADIVKELGGIENVDYSSLQDAGYMDEAEDLDEFSRSDDDSIMFEVEAFYYNPDNDKGIDGKHTIVLTGNVNMEAPYHRTGNYEDYTQDKFTFDSIEDLKEKLQKGIDKISKWFNGDNYKEGRELKMGKFEKGGVTEKEYQVSFIPAHALYEDDSSDFKEWKYVSASSVKEVKEKMGNALILDIKEVSAYAKGGKTMSKLEKLLDDKGVTKSEWSSMSNYERMKLTGKTNYAKGGEVQPYIEDLNELAENEVFSYGAVISLDLSQREINKENSISYYTIYGDDLNDAISNLLNSDEGDGLYDDDFNKYVMKVEYKKSYAKGGEVKKKENNEMLIGGIAGILLGIFLGRK